MSASPALKKELRIASKTAIKEAIRRLNVHISSGEWIGLRNKYAQIYQREPQELIARNRGRALPRLNQRQIADYIAASVFTHCGDGWSLLGRAINLQIKGDSTNSVHLAYYAELRATMSLLATEGIGVFNRKHIIMTDSNPSSIVATGRDGTHKFVWNVLEHWASRKLSSDVLAEVITPGSIPLSEWLNIFGVSMYALGQSWLKSWGMDIKQFGHDQSLRNQSSYRPSRILSKKINPAEDSLSFLTDLWRMCEPSPSSRFDEIDRYLLRATLASAYTSANSVNPKLKTNKPKYVLWVKKHIKKFGFNSVVEKSWTDFLTWETHPNEARIIEEAGVHSSVNEPKYTLQVISRAFLLLRISTGVNGKLLHEAGFTKDNIEFWWLPYAVDHGLIETGTPVSSFTDLWDDIDLTLQDIDIWKASNAGPYSYNKLMIEIPKSIFQLSECERISLWGLGI